MSIGELIGVVIATYKLFNTTEVLPALFWLVLAFVFLVRFDWSLGWLGDNDDNMEDEE